MIVTCLPPNRHKLRFAKMVATTGESLRLGSRVQPNFKTRTLVLTGGGLVFSKGTIQETPGRDPESQRVRLCGANHQTPNRLATRAHPG